MFMNGNLYEERGEDRRIRKSKKALQEALIRLLSKKSIGEITIKELTDEADVHRGTFYHHYSDAMDLKVHTEREIAEQLTEILSSVPQSRLEQGPYPLLVQASASGVWERSCLESSLSTAAGFVQRDCGRCWSAGLRTECGWRPARWHASWSG